jgi:tetratricopeptide (TPR) repeat protein
VRRAVRRLPLLVAAVVGGLGGYPAATAVHAEPGTPVADREMPALEGGKARLFQDAAASVLVFVRANQKRSLGALKELSECRESLAGKPVRWVAIVSDADSRDDVAALLRSSALAMPVLVDEGDALYGSLGVSLHPVVVVVGADRKLAAFEPFRAINYCELVTARVRHALREMSDDELQRALAPPKAQVGGDAQVALRYHALAEALFKAGNHAKAIEAVRKSLDKDPGRAQAHVLLADILAAQGRCAEASEAYGKAREIDPSSREAIGGPVGCKP